MINYLRQNKIGFSVYGLVAFALQELPYLPWLLCPPENNPLANNIPTNIFLGILEKLGGVLTVSLLILIINKSVIRPIFKNKLFYISVLCLFTYYICWIFYFSGVTNAWLIVMGLSAVVPIYYLFIALWLKNYFAILTSIIFFIGHTGSNTINYLL
jgi:hypothetical protein